MPSELTAKQVADLRQSLKNRFYELREEVRQELLKTDDEHFIDFAGRVHDLEEESVANLLVDLNLADIDRHIEEIRDIDAALIRIAERNYGICTDCDVPILAERLMAQPTASRCLRCQSLHEKTYATPGVPSL